MKPSTYQSGAVRLALVFALSLGSFNARGDLADTIDAVKPSIVVVGHHRPTASPRFNLAGTGFVGAAGNLVLTNAHVLAPPGQDVSNATLAVQVRLPRGELQMRAATVLEVDTDHDLALLRIGGEPLPTLKLQSAGTNTSASPVREGQPVAFIGFPIGGVLGYSPVTHRGAISSITPIVLPSPNARSLNERSIQRLRDGAFDIYQLDATAYPGNSGGPLFDPATGEVLGIINMVFVKSTKEAMLSQPSGITYAVPVKYALTLLQRHLPK